jgi:hypothetical protein
MESSCEFGIEPSGSMKCWKTIEWPQVVLSFIELVCFIYIYSKICPKQNLNKAETCSM